MLDWRDMVDETARAISFLSRIPVSDRYFRNHDGSLSKTVAAFPLAGLLITLPSALMLWFIPCLGGSPVIAALTALTLQMLVTGALHEDGLSDSADGLGGGRDRDRALAIMKDSRIGTYGALALILSVALRASALVELVPQISPVAVAALWLSSAAFSRAAMVWHWSALPSAKSDGVAASVGRPDGHATRIAIVFGLAAPILVCLLALPGSDWIVALIFACLLTAGFTRLVRRKLDGNTGDTIGASQQIAEIGLLTTLAILV